jgi:hypothetical protein
MILKHSNSNSTKNINNAKKLCSVVDLDVYFD